MTHGEIVPVGHGYVVEGAHDITADFLMLRKPSGGAHLSAPAVVTVRLVVRPLLDVDVYSGNFRSGARAVPPNLPNAHISHRIVTTLGEVLSYWDGGVERPREGEAPTVGQTSIPAQKRIKSSTGVLSPRLTITSPSDRFAIVRPTFRSESHCRHCSGGEMRFRIDRGAASLRVLESSRT